ncbi:MAG: SDR family NAD(P)-dependent oxidoreductase [Sphingobium sp.]|nr:SDR family NAD(P)-dependent oxidoreductase [Sphingobium sp.]MBP6111627.1 SDR family NAD(P)-dependent oxidoreductase [Sphingobium sp.]MBP8671202.1 SDR family NAD(P)-dependent oxidoreductase [Sphingobium sp.]MBP9158213.1 SDR family NAD(P)-dependent oxidoreductase [Sphingobium sp.]MCC6481450.1 SDR family NAD(P)-dependent oxidoreductase [Sphingomonadaceae bacterium]
MLIFGMGYTGTRLARALIARGWRVTGVRRQAGEDVLAFDDAAAVRAAIARASHILSSVPPDAGGQDPVLACYGADIGAAPARWMGYLSSTGVYGDTGGAWVDESAEIGGGRRLARAAADLGWQALRPDMRVFRLPGIYGPGRSALERVREGRAHRIDLLDQVFSRVHVEDIVYAILASFDAPPGVYNIADDAPSSQNDVVDYACRLLGLPAPPLIALEEAGLSAQARAFYAENRRVANGKAKRLLRWRPAYPDVRTGLNGLLR